MDEHNCKNCMFWEIIDDEILELGGLCKRYPPVLSEIKGYSGRFAENPETDYTDWCGEFKQMVRNKRGIGNCNWEEDYCLNEFRKKLPVIADLKTSYTGNKDNFKSIKDLELLEDWYDFNRRIKKTDEKEE